MRVVVAVDAIDGHRSFEAGTLIARGFAQRGHEVAVVPMGEAGAGATAALAELVADRTTAPRLLGLLVAPTAQHSGPIPQDTPSTALGHLLASALPFEGRIYLDLVGPDVHDGGAGLLHALGVRGNVALDGGVSKLRGISGADLGPANGRLAGCELVGLVPSDQTEAQLLGLRGITAARGHRLGVDPATLLETDQALADLAGALGLPQPPPGAGACGGVGLAVLALGGRLQSGPAAIAAEAGLAATVRQADLVVTGCDSLDVASRGGPVVAALSRLAEAAERPCIALVRALHVGNRELRTLGLENAYAAAGKDLVELAFQVSRTWSLTR